MKTRVTSRLVVLLYACLACLCLLGFGCRGPGNVYIADTDNHRIREFRQVQSGFWQYQMPIHIDRSKLDSDLTNFPVLVKLTSSNFDFSHARNDGYDIRFTSNKDGSGVLRYERERHDSSNQVAEYWVQIPSVSSSSDTYFYMFYGNPGASDGQDKTNVWDPNYTMVQHLHETSGTHYDSTSYGNDGTCYGGVSHSAQGKIDGARGFYGSGNYIAVGNDASLNTTRRAITIEAWVKLSALGTSQTILGESAYNNDGYRVFIDGNNKITLQIINSMDYIVPSYESIDTNWHHLAFTYDGYNGRIFQDGAEIWAYLPNDDLSPVEYYGDVFSDTDGNRVWPWGVEIWAGDPKSYFDGGEVRLIGDSADDASVLAIPDYAYKPTVEAGLNHTQSFEGKLDNVQGPGVRIIHQWFNSSEELIGTDYGSFESGTADWHTISLHKEAPPAAVRGDIIIELYGSGTLYLRTPKFYLTNTDDRKITPTAQNLRIGTTTGGDWPFNGTIDEVRISDTVRSGAWIGACYKNQSSPSTFCICGTETIVRD